MLPLKDSTTNRDTLPMQEVYFPSDARIVSFYYACFACQFSVKDIASLGFEKSVLNFMGSVSLWVLRV